MRFRNSTVVDLQELYMRRPPLYEALALDRAASVFESSEGKRLAVASSAAGAVEILKRVWRPFELLGSGSLDAREFARAANSWTSGDMDPASLDNLDGRFSALMWMEPLKEHFDELLQMLPERLAPSAELTLVVSTPLRRLSVERSREPGDRDSRMRPYLLMRRLAAAGWHPVEKAVFHGPRAILLDLATRCARGIGRADWNDRLQHAMRSAYQDKGLFWPLAPIFFARMEWRSAT